MVICLIVVPIKAIRPVSQLQNTQLFIDLISIIVNLHIVITRTNNPILDYFYSP